MDALTTLAHKSEHAADQLADRYCSLSEAVAHILDEAQWRGEAATACRQAWIEWAEGYRLVVMGLRDEATALATAATAYRSADSAGGSAITRSL